MHVLPDGLHFDANNLAYWIKPGHTWDAEEAAGVSFSSPVSVMMLAVC
jgi:hypothetical protein